jgi:hypothetical protein
MKRIVLTFIALSFVFFNVQAQVYPSTLGLRANVGNYGVGPELTYQHGIGDLNRIEAGIGANFDGNFDRFGLTGAFHWAGDVQSGFSWFAGPAIQGWIYSFNTGIHKNKFVNNGSGIGGGVGAQMGVQYDFNEELDLPFTASFDTKPMYNFVEYYSGFEFSIGLAIRYTF